VVTQILQNSGLFSSSSIGVVMMVYVVLVVYVITSFVHLFSVYLIEKPSNCQQQFSRMQSFAAD
jgi:hypothetical protein